MSFEGARPFEEARARFPLLERVAYLNAGTFGPLAQTTIDAVDEAQRADIAAGRSGTPWFEAILASRDRVRAALAREAGAELGQLALTRSTTDGINIVVAGLRIGPGDQVVTTDVEHFGLIGPLVAADAEIKVARLRGSGPGDAFELIRDEVTPQTKLIAISAVSWLTGNALPAADLREATGVPVLVDGAQSVGAIPVEAQSVDFTTISGQKWLCGPDSTGGLVVREPEALGLSQVSYFAAETYDLEQAAFEPRAGAARFDQGWIPGPALAGLEAALADLPEWRYDRARETAESLRALLIEADLDVVTGADQATLVSFRTPGDPTETVKRLAAKDVVVREIPGSGLLRASVGWWTSEDDLGRLLDGLG